MCDAEFDTMAFNKKNHHVLGKPPKGGFLERTQDLFGKSGVDIFYQIGLTRLFSKYAAEFDCFLFKFSVFLKLFGVGRSLRNQQG